MKKANEMLEKLREYLDSPEGQKDIEEHVLKMKRAEERSDAIAERINSLNNFKFGLFMERVIKEHGKEWEDECYKNAVQAYPKSNLSKLYYTAFKFGKPVNTDEEYFPTEKVLYRGYEFARIYGQGTAHFVYKNGEEVIGLA